LPASSFQVFGQVIIGPAPPASTRCPCQRAEKRPVHKDRPDNRKAACLWEGIGFSLTREVLSKKYRLGVIANQSAGTEQRLEKYGIRQYFDLIISSAEIGFSKPDLKIFEIALDKVGCTSSETYMIGDRLDNDIEPAAQLGMRTIWVRQGTFAGGSLNLICHRPDHTVDRVTDVTEYL